MQKAYAREHQGEDIMVDHDSRKSGPKDMQAILDELKQMLGQGAFDSKEAVQQAVHAHMNAVNQRPLDDFHGLSSAQLHHVLYTPFDAPELLTLCEGISERPVTMVTALFEVIAEEAKGAGIKLTPKGNLPRSVVAMAGAAIQEQCLKPESYIGRVRNEEDFEALHVTRLIAELGHLARKNRGRLLLVKATQRRLDHGDWSGIYRDLLQTYCHGFNWGYRDGYPAVPIIQQGCFFSLYLLARHGATWRPASCYADAFLRAFPMALAEIPQDRSTRVEPEEDFRRVWELRSVHRFAEFFGLVELRPDPEPPTTVSPYLESWQVRKAPVLGQVVQWKVLPPDD
jgi:hypothetical protein